MFTWGCSYWRVQQNNAVTWVHQEPVTKGQRLVGAKVLW
jgi:hypothetical protein